MLIWSTVFNLVIVVAEGLWIYAIVLRHQGPWGWTPVATGVVAVVFLGLNFRWSVGRLAARVRESQELARP